MLALIAHRPSVSHRLVLPFPPSVNRIWQWTGTRVIRDPGYRAWINTASGCVYEQCGKPRQTIKGKYALAVALDISRFGFVDQDNTVKALNDFLQRSGLVENDKWTWTTNLSWAPVQFYGGVPGCILKAESVDD